MSRQPISYDHLRARVDQIAASILCMPGQTLSDAPLESQGADSLDAIEMALMIEEEWGLQIADDDLETLATLEDIARFVAAELGIEA